MGHQNEKHHNNNNQQYNHQRKHHSLMLNLQVAIATILGFTTGMCLSALQLIIYLTLKQYNIHYYRKINYYLQYSLWAQMVAISEWWCGSTLTIFYADEESERLYGNEHLIGVSNHRYEVDPVMMWIVCDKHNNLGNAKAFCKSSLKYVPIIGWGWFFGECIFVERNWNKDAKNIGPALDNLMAYEDHVQIMMAAEGTRFTQEKYETSMQFARSKGLRQYKYHLLPRVRGFATSVRYLKAHHPQCAVYNIQFAFDDEDSASAINMIKGIPCHGDYYIKRIAIDTIPTDTDEDTAKFLYDMYTEKDQLMEYHKEHGIFPGKMVHHPRRISSLLNFIGWQITTAVLLTYLLWRVFTSHNWLLIIVTTILIFSAYVALYIVICAAKIEKASKYGTLKDIDNQNQQNRRRSQKETNDGLKKRTVNGQTNEINNIFN